MPLFGSRMNYAPRQQATNVTPVKDQYDPLQQGQTRQRRGLFGGQARGVFRREDGDPGTLANYFLFGLGGVQDMRDSRMQRDMFNSRIRSQKIEEGAAENEATQRQQRETMVHDFIATLPPDQQSRALTAYMVDPDGFAEQYLGTQQGGSWQHGQGYSHLWRPNQDGTVTLGDPLPLRPRAPSSSGGITDVPEGFVLD